MGELSIDEIKAHLEAARERSRAQTSAENTAAVKALQRRLSAAIAEGADPCPKCGAQPHGMEQPTAKGCDYEIGCLSCRDTRARAGSRRAAVILWNAGEYK
jgi:hypothetical protein